MTDFSDHQSLGIWIPNKEIQELWTWAIPCGPDPMCEHDPEMLAWYYVGVVQRREPRWTLHLPEMRQGFCNLSYLGLVSEEPHLWFFKDSFRGGRMDFAEECAK